MQFICMTGPRLCRGLCRARNPDPAIKAQFAVPNCGGHGAATQESFQFWPSARRCGVSMISSRRLCSPAGNFMQVRGDPAFEGRSDPLLWGGASATAANPAWQILAHRMANVSERLKTLQGGDQNARTSSLVAHRIRRRHGLDAPSSALARPHARGAARVASLAIDHRRRDSGG